MNDPTPDAPHAIALRSIRAARYWNQDVLASRAGVSRERISRYENGHIPSPACQKKLIEALEYDTWEALCAFGRGLQDA